MCLCFCQMERESDWYKRRLKRKNVVTAQHVFGIFWIPKNQKNKREYSMENYYVLPISVSIFFFFLVFTINKNQQLRSEFLININ